MNNKEQISVLWNQANQIEYLEIKLYNKSI